ncbi:PilZ domain-containing protein [Thermodesulfobacterium thermophilum]|uniref:PilZ domain-containing protein n=1 Tax=Thermodesulfobacterium thermophilum TaxID=886 RepID=UPI0003B615A0|nr:PilZ domain-containing protein [Thermodesulfobacterium thermophilum]
MLERVELSKKITLSVLQRNISLGSLEYLPTHIKQNLDFHLKKAILLYSQHKVEYLTIKPITGNSLEIQVFDSSKFEIGKIILIILQEGQIRYIFQCLVKKIENNRLEVEILPPRYDERIKISGNIPVFMSIMQKNIGNQFLQSDYYLIRESNFDIKFFEETQEIYFYDLVIDNQNNVDPVFKNYISKNNLMGVLVDISSGGACVKVPSLLLSFSKEDLDQLFMFYLKFEIPSKEKKIKFGLLSSLRNLRYEQNSTYFHFMFLLSFKNEIWKKIKSLLTFSTFV